MVYLLNAWLKYGMVVSIDNYFWVESGDVRGRSCTKHNIVSQLSFNPDHSVKMMPGGGITPCVACFPLTSTGNSPNPDPIFVFYNAINYLPVKHILHGTVQVTCLSRFDTKLAKFYLELIYIVCKIIDK